MKLSIAMIVKNEEKNLERTLIALKKLQDDIGTEIVIVDTGSTDNTINIAKKYTDKVYFHKWDNDFAAMRNISISYCTGDWILVVDADEVLYDIKNLANLLKSDEFNKYNAAHIEIINYNKNIENSIDNGFVAPILRLFKKNTVKYTGIIHEQPNYSPPVIYSNIRFIHYGYNNNDYELMEYKFRRNLDLLFKQLNDKSNSHSMNIYINFQISTSYAMHKDIREALKYIKIAYRKAKNEINKYMYVINRYCHLLYNTKEFSDLVDKAKEGIKYCSNFIDFYFYLGEAYYNLYDYDNAIDAYNKYLYFHDELKNNNIIINDTLTILTREYKDSITCNLAVSYYKCNYYEKALETLLKINNRDLLLNKAHFVLRIIVEGKLWNRINVLDNLIDKYNYDTLLFYVHKEILKEDLNTIENIKLSKTINEIVSSVKYFKENNNLTENHVSKIKKVIEQSKIPYSIYLYYILKYDIREIKFFIPYGKDKIETILIDLASCYFDFNDVLLKGLKEVFSNVNNMDDILIKTIIEKALLLSGNLPQDKKKELFLEYISEKYYIIIKSYSNEIIKGKFWMLSSEERFIIELKETLTYKYKDTLKYIKAMKDILDVQKTFIDYIKLLTEIDKEFTNNNQIKTFIPELIKNIQVLMNGERYQEAYDTIEEALSLVKFDFDLMVLKYNLLLNSNYEKKAKECLRDIILYGDNERVIELINNL